MPSPLEDSPPAPEVFLVMVIVGGEQNTTALQIRQFSKGARSADVTSISSLTRRKGLAVHRRAFPEEAVLQGDLG